MATKEAMEELTSIGEAISLALEKDKKRNKKSRNASYRAKRIAEGTELWAKFNTKFTELQKLVDKKEPCVQEKMEKYQRIYKEYTDKLLAIPTEDPTDDESSSDEDNNEVLLKLQSKRFVALHHAMQDVLTKIDNNELASASYSEVKKQKIINLWRKVENDDELIDEGVIGYEAYRTELEKVEVSIEKSLIFLQEQLSAKSDTSEGLKLNRVDIKKFDGDYFEWITFKDLFTSLVVNNKKMGKAEKMHRLKTHVTGEVGNMIKDLTVSDVNFDCAWDRIMGRYNNERVLIGKMIDKILNQPSCRGDSKSLKKLLDTTDQMILGLENLKRPTEHWDDWIIIIIGYKLDDATQKDWERKIGKATTIPTWMDLKTFLEEQFRLMERIEGSHKKQERGNDRQIPGKPIKAFQASVEQKCVLCEETHSLYNCQKWKDMTPKDRLQVVKKNKWCKKCLRSHDAKAECDKTCKKCKKAHSTWLHENREQNQLTVAHGYFNKQPYEVLLATAVIQTVDSNGNAKLLRVLIDSGSEGSLITQAAADMLNTTTIRSDRWIQGLGDAKNVPLKKIHLTIQPRFSSKFSLELDFYILKTLTKMLPGHNMDPTSWKHIQNLTWADPTFHKKGKIDALLGMDALVDIMNTGFIKGISGQPMAQSTKLGWVFSGKIDPTYPTDNFKCFITTHEVNYDLRQFWEMEELFPERELTPAEKECEEFYSNTVRKTDDGKFIVKIPFKKEPLGPERLGDSRGQAIARFLQIEKKLAQDNYLSAEYKKAIRSYLEMGHMKEVTDLPKECKHYYIPHHAVVKPDHLTTKVRIVFDASAKTTTGWSLNECMHVGAKQQRDLSNLLINWRMFQVSYKADIEKMYRMIQLDENDQKYHTIIWRDSPTEPIREYQMTATTFGTAAAPFLATRTLIQIAEEQENAYPLASAALKDNFYMDDLLGGSHSLEEAVNCKNELLTVLTNHHLPLRKWVSNSPEFLQTLPLEITENVLKQTIFEDETSKALGLLWSPQADTFSYKINWLQPDKSTWTKRQFLSETSKLFDPLGWLAPTTINAKLLMQEVWTQHADKCKWDDEIPTSIATKWIQFRNEFKELEKISIKRWIDFVPSGQISVHGFSDASEKGYSAVIYARVEVNDEVTTALIASKTRVAPIKSKLTIPQLELCGAELAAKLMNVVIKALKLQNPDVYLWTDSMITLGWIKNEPNRWKTFVANRVAKIQSHNSYKWNYVPTDTNPADCASRGIMPLELVNHPLWWTGPDWLQRSPMHWPSADIQDHDLEQRKSFAVNMAQIEQNDVVEQSSSWYKLRRIAAYCRRFKTKQTGMLNVDEIRMAEKGLIKQTQWEAFYPEIKALRNGNQLEKGSKLKSLNVFLDKEGVLRVGGRLDNSDLPYGAKHPMVLLAGNHLTKIIIRQMHLDTQHGGPKLMKNLLKKKFWIIQSTKMVQQEFHQCITCKKFKGQLYKQQMGNLPEARVTLNRAFGYTGVDYAGPIEIKSSNLRSAKIQKGYIALFVCMGTKAVHLELVSDQTTQAFLAAFNRFTARRGLPNEMYSDNGTNFEGANNQLQRLYFLEQNQAIAKVAVNNEISWKFIPPGSPNFGGLWERAVRSMKDHLRKTLKYATLTFEEYSTLLCQVEACMNSRPLCSASDNDTEELEVLTPGHFLIGQELLAPPQPATTLKLTNNRDRWKYVQWIQNQLWVKWNQEYLSSLQQRHKWQEASENAKPGDVVAIMNEDLAPRNWLIGKIEEVHKGTDNKVRVATIRIPAKKAPTGTNKKEPVNMHMKSKLIQRPIRKLCPLIVEEKEQVIIEEHYKQRPKKTQNLSHRATPLLTMALIFFGLLFGVAAATTPAPQDECIQTTIFKENAGIYFEDLGRAKMTRSEWKIQIYFDLEKYNEDLSMIKETISKLQTLCTSAEDAISNAAGRQCSHTVAMLQQQLNDMIEMNVIIQQNKQATANRTRRAAPFNFVGWMGNKLFGIMDAGAAERLEQRIEHIKTGQTDLQRLIREQTSIVELTKNLLKESQDESQQKFNILTTAIMTLSNETDLYRKRDQIIGWALYTALVVNKVEKNQHNIINMLTDLQQGHISSYLFTPHQFKIELEKINDLIPTGYNLPVNPQTDIKIFYEIMRGRMRVTKKHILLEITLPLVSVDEFQVFHLVPVPVQHDNEQICIIPESQYLLITLKRDLFYQMNENELTNCIKTEDIPIICPAVHSAESVTSSKGLCERGLLAGSKQIQKCHINVIPIKEVWIHLKATNNWLFGLQNKTVLNVVKGGNVDTVTLQGNGLMVVQPGCEVSHEGSTIIGHSQFTTTANHNFQPVLNLSDLIKQQSSVTRVINLTMTHTDWRHKINHDMINIDKTIQSHYTVNGAINIGMSILLIGSIGVLYLVLKYKSRFNKWLHPQQHVIEAISSQHGGPSAITTNTNEMTSIKTRTSLMTEQCSADSNDSNDIEAAHRPNTRQHPGECPFRT